MATLHGTRYSRLNSPNPFIVFKDVGQKRGSKHCDLGVLLLPRANELGEKVLSARSIGGPCQWPRRVRHRDTFNTEPAKEPTSFFDNSRPILPCPYLRRPAHINLFAYPTRDPMAAPAEERIVGAYALQGYLLSAAKIAYSYTLSLSDVPTMAELEIIGTPISN